jgi:hypothetical protein
MRHWLRRIGGGTRRGSRSGHGASVCGGLREVDPYTSNYHQNEDERKQKISHMAPR